MDVVRVAYVAAAMVLAMAGFVKLRDPAPANGALRAVGVSAGEPVVRGLAVIEVLVALLALTVTSALTALVVMLFYLGFAAFVMAVIVRRVPIRSCGCFGAADTPPSAAHVSLDMVAAVVALITAIDPPSSLLRVLRDQPSKGVLTILLSGTIAGAVITYFGREVSARGNRAASSTPIRR